jgi:proton-dependent oligopeptide transporter, POT family
MSDTLSPAAEKHGHPRGLYVLFSAEAWERFSYYTMRALLVLYLTKAIKYSREDALAVYGWYTGLVYLTPVIGGYLADKVLGQRKAIIIGGLLMMAGHLAMAFEPLLYPALGLLIVGNGFFKPNISTIVGGLYEQGDRRRDAGFTIFYMGINLGAFFAAFAGQLGEKTSWHVGFSLAAFGMALGLGVFVGLQRLLGSVGFAPKVQATPESRLGARDWRDILVISVAAGAAVCGIMTLESMPLLGAILGVGVLIVSFVPFLEAKREKLNREEWHRIIVIVVLCIFNVFFWMGFEQAGGTMTLFADEQTARPSWMGATLFQALNPLFIVVLAPFFSAMWNRLDRTRFAMSTPTKMSIGLITLGLGFVVMYFAQEKANLVGKVGIQWLMIVYFIHTIGELCLSPIGLSMVTKLSPARTVSLMMGIWFGSTSIANYSAGTLEAFLHQFGIPLYGFLFVVPIGTGIMLLFLTPWLKKWAHGRG